MFLRSRLLEQRGISEQRASAILLWVRIFNAATFVGIMAWSWIDHVRLGYSPRLWFVYLTHWMLVAVVVYLCQAAVMMVLPLRACGGAPVIVLSTWAVQSLALPGALVVVPLFWIGVAPTLKRPPEAINYFCHRYNAVVMLIDFFLAQQSFHRLHGFAALLLVTLAYVVFSILYYYASGCQRHVCDLDGTGHPYVYSVLNWDKPHVALVTAFLAVAVPVPLCVLGLSALSRAKGDPMDTGSSFLNHEPHSSSA